MSGASEPDFNAIVQSLQANSLPSGWRWVGSSPDARVATDGCYYAKLFLARSIWEWPKQLVRGGRGERAVKEALRLQRLGFLSPQVCASGHIGLTQWMVTRAVDALSFGDFICTFFAGAGEREGIARARLYRELGALVGRLHRSGVIHGDLRPNNVLLGGRAGEALFYLIDNERNRQFTQPPRRGVHKNLVQIQMLFEQDFNTAERQRFMTAYRQARGVDEAECQALAEASQRRVNERLAGKSTQDLIRSIPEPVQTAALVQSLKGN